MRKKTGKKGNFLLKAAAGLGIAAAACGGEIAYFYGRTMKRSRAKTERTMKMSGTDWNQYMPLIEKRKEAMLDRPHSDVWQESFDGLKLHGTYFPVLAAGQRRKRIVICFHGYTSQGMSDYIGLSDYYQKRNFAMLLPDARAHGMSEGEYVGFGCPDRRDALVWINWVIAELGSDVEILLHGTSMGAATLLMLSGLTLPEQVKGIVADCGFTSPKEVFTHVLHSMYHLPAFPVIPGADMVNRRLAGYGMDECNARREVEKATVPILFIHGELDTFVPCSMCDEMYEHCASPKSKLIVAGAAHAESYYKDMESYESALTQFIEQTMD
ncbi:MAG: alpha/beta hydrolase [Lachnospiraceae bacterium]|nr:alpha/beta hydrolase [Lachnospiraceae bacterium]